MGFLSSLFKASPEDEFKKANYAELTGNDALAFQIFSELAKNNHAKSKYHLAHMYLSERAGRGLDYGKRSEIAMQLMEEAAYAGHQDSIDFVTRIKAAREEAEASTPAKKAKRDAICKVNSATLQINSNLAWAGNANIAGNGMTWDEAMNWVKNLNFDGYSDWRLPTIEEFIPFIDQAGSGPYKWFNANGYKNVQSEWYWTSCTDVTRSDCAYIVYMGDGDASSGSKNNPCKFVWPVRDIK